MLKYFVHILSLTVLISCTSDEEDPISDPNDHKEELLIGDWTVKKYTDTVNGDVQEYSTTQCYYQGSTHALLVNSIYHFGADGSFQLESTCWSTTPYPYLWKLDTRLRPTTALYDEDVLFIHDSKGTGVLENAFYLTFQNKDEVTLSQSKDGKDLVFKTIILNRN